MTGYIALSWWDLVLASLFVLLNGAASMALGLRLERQIVTAALRMTAQLYLVGLLLSSVFALASPWLTIGIALIMALFAGNEVRARQERRLTGVWGLGLGAGAVAFASLLITVIGVGALIQPQPWWSPRFALPLFGMILGNAMTGVALGLDTLISTARRERDAIEAQLLLGATRWRAFGPCARRAFRSGLTPIVNAMAATGVVSLPGMMTGQILSGVAPEEAVKYQLLVMFLIGGATCLGVLIAVTLGVRRLSDERARLRLDRISA